MLTTSYLAAAVACFSTCALGVPSPAAPPQALPTVDLGYEIHQAIAYNDTGNYYNFTNIRYAAAPVGNLRFRAPKTPATNRKTVQTGAGGAITCPQADPSWIDFAATWIPEYLTGRNITITQQQVTALNSSLTISTVPAQAAGASEDCLFLDVFAPKKIFNKAGSAKGSPVLVWIYGGGYTAGSKTGSGDPAGLLERSMFGGNEGVIYVAMNYRLGAFGWLGGPTIGADGTPNVGLYDQRFALEWVQQYIHLFGGDPTRVTVFGESAGGGSIEHQITAYGGLMPVPFQRAIPQSPGFQTRSSAYDLEGQLQRFMSLTNTTTLDELRALPSSTLIAANTLQVFQSEFGSFTYGPAVDGYFVPALPGQSLAEGHFAQNVEVMVGHNLDEGLLFTPFIYNSDDGFMLYLQQAFPHATQDVLSYITNTLYPAVFDGSLGYKDNIARLALLISEVFFTCNDYFFGEAYNGKDYAYYFTIYPGLHGSDVPYTYYNGGPATSSVLNTTAAIALQDWIVTFATNGVPRTPDVPAAPKFVMWGNGTDEDLGLSTITHAADPTDNARCVWWQKGLYL